MKSLLIEPVTEGWCAKSAKNSQPQKWVNLYKNTEINELFNSRRLAQLKAAEKKAYIAKIKRTHRCQSHVCTRYR